MILFDMYTEGQLGYPSVDTQPTPRRVSSLRSRIIAVAAANKHTAAVAESGEVFTWGCNKEGQLGYGTSNSASNYTPRVVEYLKGRNFKAVSVAKYHTVVLGADGEVYNVKYYPLVYNYYSISGILMPWCSRWLNPAGIYVGPSACEPKTCDHC